MPTARDAFDAIEKITTKQTRTVDKKGFADKFKEAAKTFFINVKKYGKELLEQEITIKDVEYLDGYFIFGFGSNSVVHFRVEECPGWLFAIWWNVPEKIKQNGKKVYPEYIEGQFFTQYEKEINKFKPTRSNFCADITIFPGKEDMWSNGYDGAKMINFIAKEPYLAFCRDYHGWDYNEEYHSREEAVIAFNEYLVRDHIKEEFESHSTEKILAWVKENIIPLYSDAIIIDRGERWSPRYELVAPFGLNKNLYKDSEAGYYYDWNQILSTKALKAWNRLQKDIEKEADEKELWWFCPIHSTVLLYDDTKFGSKDFENEEED